MMNLLLTDRGDGGELILKNGDLVNDDSLFTAIYLSLFTGDCFYNIFEDFKTSDEFEELMNLPATIQNLQKLEISAKNSLKWLQDNDIVKDCKIFAYASNDNKMNIDISLNEPDGVNIYSIIWENEKLILKKNRA